MRETAGARGSGHGCWLRLWLPTAAVRIHLLGIPLERDEGEYAYGGQLMLHGIPPYKLVYSMKFPGIDAAYAAIMAVFGQTIIGIHVGFMLVNAATIVLVYLLGKRLFSSAAGVAASAAYALLSIGQGVLGTQAHATHFVVLAALGGTLLLLRGIDSRRWPTLLWSGAALRNCRIDEAARRFVCGLRRGISGVDYFTGDATAGAWGERSGNISLRSVDAAGADRFRAVVGWGIRQILVLDVHVCTRI